MTQLNLIIQYEVLENFSHTLLFSFTNHWLVGGGLGVGGCELVRPSWHFPLSNLLSEPNHFILRKKQRELCGATIGSFKNSGFGSQEILTEKISNHTLRFWNKTKCRICFTRLKWSISIFEKLGVNIVHQKYWQKSSAVDNSETCAMWPDFGQKLTGRTEPMIKLEIMQRFGFSPQTYISRPAWMFLVCFSCLSFSPLSVTLCLLNGTSASQRDWDYAPA